MTFRSGSHAARVAAVIVPFFVLSALSYGQAGNPPGQAGNGPGRGPGPAVASGPGVGIRPHVWVHQKINPGSNLMPNALQPNTAILNPAQLTAAYGMNTVPGLGKGATIAIVDAYDAPNAASDLAAFISNFGISCPSGPATFTKLNQNGASSPLPGPNSGWEVEISLDVQWARAVAPCANVILVEANSNNDSDLMAAVSTAANLASVVSMSWGGGEWSGELSYDSFFSKTGVTFLASSGDTGGIVEWPSIAANVIGVGGTNLSLDSSNNVLSETAWNGSGGGCSTQEPALAVQSGFVPSTCQKRAAPDISVDGGDQSPVYVYISGQGGWYSVYGTSLAVQLAGASVGLANGMRATAGHAPLNGTLAAFYGAAAGIPSSSPYTSNFRDITSGTAGSFTAGAGWDFITGLGTPLVGYIVPNTLAGQGTSPDFSISATPSSQTVAQGGSTSYSMSVGALNGFSGVVNFSASNLPSGASAIFTPPSVTNSGVSSVTITTSGSTPLGTYSNVLLVGTGPSTTHSATVTLVVKAKPDFSMSANPTSVSVVQGASTKSTISLTAINGFANNVALSVLSGCPTNATCSFSPASVKPTGSSVLTIASTTTTPAKSYTVTVQGNDPTHTTNVKVTVVADFTLSVSPLSVTRGSSGHETVGVGEVNAGDATSVTLSVSGLPSQTNASFAANPVPSSGTGSTLTISTGNKTKAGNYQITVTGANGSATHSATFTLSVK